MIDKRMMGRTNKRYAKNGSTLRMPAKFSFMTEEEAEYGGGCWAWVFFVIGGLCFVGAGVCFVAPSIWNFGDKDTMDLIGSFLCTAGIVFLTIGWSTYGDVQNNRCCCPYPKGKE